MQSVPNYRSMDWTNELSASIKRREIEWLVKFISLRRPTTNSLHFISFYLLFPFYNPAFFSLSLYASRGWEERKGSGQGTAHVFFSSSLQGPARREGAGKGRKRAERPRGEGPSESAKETKGTEGTATQRRNRRDRRVPPPLDGRERRDATTTQRDGKGAKRVTEKKKRNFKIKI